MLAEAIQMLVERRYIIKFQLNPLANDITILMTSTSGFAQRATIKFEFFNDEWVCGALREIHKNLEIAERIK